MLKFPHSIRETLFEDVLQRINVLHTALIHIPTTSRQYVFHRQILKSSLFSARIEGNTLTLEAIEQENIEDSSQKNKIEVSNILRAFKQLEKISTIDLQTIQNLHSIILQSLNPSSGKFRSETSAIFDQYGTAVYVTPDLHDMQLMLIDYMKNTNLQNISPGKTLIKTAQCHYYFEKIHPFIDGNGRTGRVLMHWQLKKISEYFLPIDQYFDENRSEYYRLLEKNSRDTQEFTAFFLEGVYWSLDRLLQDIKSIPEQKNDEALLLPRRQEILAIIKEHPQCTRDFIARRFPTLSTRMIAYDLEDLIKKGLVQKHGETRGVVYSAT